MITQDTLDRYRRRTNFDATSYLTLYNTFYTSYYGDYTNYFDGIQDSLPTAAHDTFERLREQTLIFDDVMKNADNALDKFEFWDLIELMDEIKTQVLIIQSFGRFRRSAQYKALKGSAFVEDFDVIDGQTPEMVANLDRVDPENDWVDIYTKSGIKETDYNDGKGGYRVQLGRINSEKTFLRAVVDYMIGENVYGKDIANTFEYRDDDVRVLTGKDTVAQAVNNLVGAQKYDFPNLPQVGMSPELLVGSSIGLAGIPFLTREIEETLALDDTLVSVVLKDVKRVEASIFVEFEVESYYHYFQSVKIELK